MQKRKGFTLIELLVVIAIIAILAAILFPIFTNAREKGKQTRCASNMKQLASAIMAYSDDADGAMPVAWTSSNWSEGTWRQRIQPYAKSKGILRCMSKTYAHQINPQENRNNDPWSHYGLTQGLTHRAMCPTPGFMVPAGSWSAYFGFVFFSRIPLPSQTIMVAENVDGDWSTEPMTAYSGLWGGEGTFYPYHMRRSNDPRDYNCGGNFIFCDGHVKFMTVNAAEGWDPGSKTRNFKLWIADRGFKINPLNSTPNG